MKRLNERALELLEEMIDRLSDEHKQAAALAGFHTRNHDKQRTAAYLIKVNQLNEDRMALKLMMELVCQNNGDD